MVTRLALAFLTAAVGSFLASTTPGRARRARRAPPAPRQLPAKSAPPGSARAFVLRATLASVTGRRAELDHLVESFAGARTGA